MEIHLHALPNSHQIIPQGTNREITSFIKLDVSGEQWAEVVAFYEWNQM